MTVEKLKEYRYLKQLIELERGRLEDLRDSLGPHGSALTGMPKSPGAKDKIGDVMPTIVDKATELEKKIQMLEEKRNEIEAWIDVQPVKIQIICQLRFFQGQTWDQIATLMDDGEGPMLRADAIRMAFTNHLRQEAGTGGSMYEDDTTLEN